MCKSFLTGAPVKCFRLPTLLNRIACHLDSAAAGERSIITKSINKKFNRTLK